MKCTSECPMDALRALGRACQFKDMRDEENSCKFQDVMDYHYPDDVPDDNVANIFGEKVTFTEEEIEVIAKAELDGIGEDEAFKA